MIVRFGERGGEPMTGIAPRVNLVFTTAHSHKNLWSSRHFSSACLPPRGLVCAAGLHSWSREPIPPKSSPLSQKNNINRASGAKISTKSIGLMLFLSWALNLPPSPFRGEDGVVYLPQPCGAMSSASDGLELQFRKVETLSVCTSCLHLSLGG